MLCTNTQTITPQRSTPYWRDTPQMPITVPCGKCLSCLSNKRTDWAFRLVQEHKASKSAYFVTLTYDRKHMPEDWAVSKRELQLYLKRVRKHDGQNKVRYYAVGEYGTKTNRPHYHLLLFNTYEKDIRKAWNKGIVHVGRVTEASVAYVLKYLVQPDSFPKGKQKPFSLMSRGYGIGAHYLSDAMINWHRDGDKNYTNYQGKKGRLPRYYRDKIWWKPQDRARVADDSKWRAIKQARAELKWYWKKYGDRGKQKLTENRNAVISRIKIKVAFTQHL